MPVAVVDLLEVVDVDEAERERPALLLGEGDLALEPLVEVPVVAESRERVGEREAHRFQRRKGRALVERDREQRPDKSHRQRRRALPQDDEHQCGRGHERERRGRLIRVVPDQLEERLARARCEHGADQDEVDDPVVEKRAQRDAHDQRAHRVLGNQLDRKAARERRQREHRAVVRDAEWRAEAEQVRDGWATGGDDHTCLPAEEDDRRHGEHEAERDPAGVDAFDGDRKSLGQHHSEKEASECCDVCSGMRSPCVRDACRDDGRDPRQDDGGHKCENS